MEKGTIEGGSRTQARVLRIGSKEGTMEEKESGKGSEEDRLEVKPAEGENQART